MSDKDAPQQNLFELFQKMVSPLAFPMQTLLFPTLDPEELGKKISELKTVESWLAANLSMLRLTIRTLEYQRTLLTPSEEKAKDERASPAENPFTNPNMWPWNLMRQVVESTKPSETPEKTPPEEPQKPRSPKR